MPFLDPEELKPKLREVFETVVIPQIKKAKMKQTAVEWYTDALKQWDLCYMESNGKISKDVYESTKISLQEKAKAMEKEHIKDAWLNSLTKGDYNSAEEYYNKTFKSE